MQYPLISEYIEAIRSAEDNFDQYSALRPVLDDKGNPVMSSGNFAVVFKMRDELTKRLYAVKCFTRDQEGRHENYRRIAEELEFVSSPYFVHFRFLEKELFVDTSQGDAEEYPVLVMDWVEGEPLDRYLRAHLRDTYALQLLAYRFCRMGAWLLSQPFAHGDLKPDNILVKADGTLVLVDYDGMFVPAMQGEQAGELGSPDFRHPLRTAADFNEHIDDFSMASIALSLKAIALQPSLYDQFAASDRLLFAASDYMDLGKSAVLPALCPLTSDAELSTLLSTFLLAHAKNSLGMISFRLFLLHEPVKPKVEVWRTNVTDEDRAQAILDEYGVLYSPDGVRLIEAIDNDLTAYEIKEGTKVICDEAFSDCESLTTIHLPDSVTMIGSYPFPLVGCERFTITCDSPYFLMVDDLLISKEGKLIACLKDKPHITIPDSVTTIGDWAFEGCKSLTTIHLPESVTTIGDSAFWGCESLILINIPNSVATIGKKAFCGCESLTTIHLPESLTTIRSGTFAFCKSLTTIHLPDSVTTIGDWAFEGCKSLTTIHLPDSVTTIGNIAFSGCEFLTLINIPNSVTTMGSNPFNGCKRIASIGQSSHFYMVDGFLISKEGKLITCFTDARHITVPESVTTIGDSAFLGCESLTSIHIPDSVTMIGDGAYWRCSSLTTIHLPGSVTSIGKDAFLGCESLTSIHIPDSVTTIRSGTFAFCKSLTTIHLPDSITMIGDGAFRRCSSLTTIHLPGSVTSIGKDAFLDCESLTSIHLPDSVTSIGDSAFRYCESLTSIHFPNSVTTIKDYAFSWCTSLTTLYLPDSVNYIGSLAFYCSNSLTTIHIPKGTKDKFKGLLKDSDLINKLVEE